MSFPGVYSFDPDCEVYVLHKRWLLCFAGTAALVGASACIVWVHMSGQTTGPSPCAHGCVVDAKHIILIGLIYRGFVRITCHIDLRSRICPIQDFIKKPSSQSILLLHFKKIWKSRFLCGLGAGFEQFGSDYAGILICES